MSSDEEDAEAAGATAKSKSTPSKKSKTKKKSIGFSFDFDDEVIFFLSFKSLLVKSSCCYTWCAARCTTFLEAFARTTTSKTNVRILTTRMIQKMGQVLHAFRDNSVYC